jgi:hypothetical protein
VLIAAVRDDRVFHDDRDNDYDMEGLVAARSLLSWMGVEFLTSQIEGESIGNVGVW